MGVRAAPHPWMAAGPVLAGAAALVGCAVLAVVDPNETRVPLCPFRAVTGLDCPGCGGLRATSALLRGDLWRALDHNLVTVLLLPVLVWGWLGWLAASLGVRDRPPALPAWSGFLLAGVLTVFWVARNLPVAALSWLGSGAG